MLCCFFYLCLFFPLFFNHSYFDFITYDFPMCPFPSFDLKICTFSSVYINHNITFKSLRNINFIFKYNNKYDNEDKIVIIIQEIKHKRKLLSHDSNFGKFCLFVCVCARACVCVCTYYIYNMC